MPPGPTLEKSRAVPRNDHHGPGQKNQTDPKMKDPQWKNEFMLPWTTGPNPCD